MFLKQLPLPELVEQSDENLLEQFQLTGEQHFFAELYRRYVHLIYFMSFRYLDRPEDRQDLVMLVFEKLLKELERLPKIKSFNNYLHSMTRHECINWQRRQQRWEVNQTNFEKSCEKVVKNGALPRLYSREQNFDAFQQLEEALAQLEDHQYQCIRLFFFERKSYKEIAAETGYNTQMVKSYLQNGKRKLKHMLLKKAGNQYGNFI